MRCPTCDGRKFHWSWCNSLDAGDEHALAFDEHVYDVESFQSHYADEIEGRAEPIGLATNREPPSLRNADGQLRLPFPEAAPR